MGTNANLITDSKSMHSIAIQSLILFSSGF